MLCQLHWLSLWLEKCPKSLAPRRKVGRDLQPKGKESATIRHC